MRKILIFLVFAKLFILLLRLYEKKSHAMLLEFTVGNYKSFKEKKTLSLEATSITEYPNNVAHIGEYKILKSAAVYGANSSGKSNLIKAFGAMKDIITSSAKYNSTDEIPVEPFLLCPETENKESFFEIVFLLKGEQFRYGFEANKKSIKTEWLYKKTKVRENKLFIRDGDIIELGSQFKEAKGLETKVKHNSLLLSISDQFNGKISNTIMVWINRCFPSSNSTWGKGIASFLATLLNLSSADSTKNLLIYLNPISAFTNKYFNLGFSKLFIEEGVFKTEHYKYSNNGTIVGSQIFNLQEQESTGTNKLVPLSLIIYLSLQNGATLILDELDANLHPLLTLSILKIYNSPQENPNNAQLIFATHDTNLLDNGGLRRDQIYFTEKDSVEATDLYSLVEYKEPDGKKVRKDRSFKKDYIAGRYGAIPYIGDFSKIWQE